MMRTTVRLNDRLLREAKEFAARNRRTLTSVIEDALRHFLARTARTQRPLRALPTFKGDPPGLLPGVDLDDSAALLELMERERDRRYRQKA